MSVYCKRIAHWKYWRLCRPERKTKWPSSSAPVLRKSASRSSLIWGAHAAGVPFSAARRKLWHYARCNWRLKNKMLVQTACEKRSTSRRTEHASGVRSPDAERSYPDVSYAAWSASAAAAITSISTLAPLGNAETCTVERAGGSCLKYEPYISFTV